jgi:flagellin
MSSINTNLSAMTALQSLKATQTAMNKNQNQISTGLRVSEASQNASYWSIATQMKSDNGALGAVKDSIKQSKSMINTFTSAMDKSLTYLNKMKEGLVAASQPGADLAKIQTEFKAHIEGMKSAAGSASFNGQNWLAQSNPETVKLVTSYDGTSNTVGTLSIDTTNTNLFTDAASGKGGLLGDVAKIGLSFTKGVDQAGTLTGTGTKGSAEFTKAAFTGADNSKDLSFKIGTGAAITFKVASDDLDAIKTSFNSAAGGTAVATVEGTGASAKLVIKTTANTADAITATYDGGTTGVTTVAGTADTGTKGTSSIATSDIAIKEGVTFAAKVGSTSVKVTATATDTLDTMITKFNSDASNVGGAIVAAKATVDGQEKLVFTSKNIGESVSANVVGTDLAAALKSVDQAIAKVTEGSAMLGANKALLETQEEFIGTLSDSLTAGVSAFIDADMNEASTRNQALQTQQQLGVQALSMANQNSQMILKLFQ